MTTTTLPITYPEVTSSLTIENTGNSAAAVLTSLPLNQPETMENTANSAAVAPTAPLFKKRNAKSKSSIRKRAATPPPSNSDDDSFVSSSAEDEGSHKIKRRKKNTGAITASSANGKPKDPSSLMTSTIYEASRTGIQSTNDATKSREWYDEAAPDLRSKALLGSTRPQGPKSEVGTYKPLAQQTSFLAKNPNAPTRQVGPMKAASNIRTITVTDFAPDVCKDYKQTGFCGFGDNCKFLHAREDYKQGWQLDREWENVTKGKNVSGGTKFASADRSAKSNNEDEEDSDGEDAEKLENIPFACILCKEAYKEAVVTKCGHYFCEACALKRYRKDPSCAACGAGTGGVFNVARGLRKLLERKRERVRRRRERARDAGEEASDGEEGEEEE